MNPLQILRDIIAKYELTGDDILHRMKKKLNDEPLNFNQLKDSLSKIDASLTPLQLKSLFGTLKNNESNRVEIPFLIENLTGDVASSNFKKEMQRKISDFIMSQGLQSSLRESLEKHDFNHDGKVLGDQVLAILKMLKMPI